MNKLSHYVKTGEELTDSRFVSFTKDGLRAIYDTVEKWDKSPELKLQEYNGGFGQYMV